jgi:leucyl aminopeptidase
MTAIPLELVLVDAASDGALPVGLVLPGTAAAAGSAEAAAIAAQRRATHGETVRAVHGPVDGRPGLLVGVGEDRASARTAGAAIARDADTAVVALGGLRRLGDGDRVAALLDGVVSAAYRFNRHRTRPAASVALERLEIVRSGDAARDDRLAADLAAVLAAAPATRLARDLVNESPSILTPTAMAEVACDVAARADLDVEVMDEAALEAGGFGAITGVGRGSAQPPCLVVLSTRTQDPVARVALVGKGITFDAGGLFLKKPSGMADMKGDMAGAAAILGAMSVVAAVAPRVAVRGYLALAENLPGPRATKPGDVLRTRNGLTIEVNDPDAEGRMVLSDALALAGEAAPDLIVDLATLTGSKVQALGSVIAAIYATNERAAALVEEAGRAASEPVWRMPLADAYRSRIDSRVADLKICDLSPSAPDSIIAALFLREFVPDGTAWVHVDMAGGEIAERDGEVPEGMATGFGARLLVELLRRLGGGAWTA